MIKKMLNPVVAATIIVIMYTIMPIMTVLISRFITTYAYMLMCVALFVFIMLAGGLRRLSAIAYVLVPVGIYVLCTLVSNSEILMAGYQGLLLLLPIAAGYYFVYYRDDTVPEFTKIIVAAITITAITTIIGAIRFPEASRILATITESDNSESIKYSWNNIGGYEFVYTCVLLYPILILAYKQRKIGRVAFLSLFSVLLALIIFAEYTIALLLFMITSILFFVGKKATVNQMIMTGIIMVIIFLAFQPVFEKFFLWLADIFESKVFNERLTALAGGVNGIENSESNRIQLYRDSINAFLKSPVFGNMLGGGSAGGGHSFILGCLANYGIIGGITLVVIYRNLYRVFFLPFQNKSGYGFVLWTFVQAILLSSINTGAWFSVLALFVPVLLSQIYNTYSEDDYEDSLDS